MKANFSLEFWDSYLAAVFLGTSLELNTISTSTINSLKLISTIAPYLSVSKNTRKTPIYEALNSGFDSPQLTHLYTVLSSSVRNLNAMQTSISTLTTWYAKRSPKTSLLKSQCDDLFKIFSMKKFDERQRIWQTISDSVTKELIKLGLEPERDVELEFLKNTNYKPVSAIHRKVFNINDIDITGSIDMFHHKGDISAGGANIANFRGFENIADLALLQIKNSHVELSLDTFKHVFAAIRRMMISRAESSKRETNDLIKAYVYCYYSQVCRYGLDDTYPVNQIREYLISHSRTDESLVSMKSDFALIDVYTRKISKSQFLECLDFQRDYPMLFSSKDCSFGIKFFLALAEYSLQFGNITQSRNYMTMHKEFSILNEESKPKSEFDSVLEEILKVQCYFGWGDKIITLSDYSFKRTNTIDNLILADLYIQMQNLDSAEIIFNEVKCLRLKILEEYVLHELEIDLMTRRKLYHEAFLHSIACSEKAKSLFQKLKFVVRGLRALVVSDKASFIMKAKPLIDETFSKVKANEFKLLEFELFVLNLRIILFNGHKEEAKSLLKFKDTNYSQVANITLDAEFYSLCSEIDENLVDTEKFKRVSLLSLYTESPCSQSRGTFLISSSSSDEIRFSVNDLAESFLRIKLSEQEDEPGFIVPQVNLPKTPDPHLHSPFRSFTTIKTTLTEVPELVEPELQSKRPRPSTSNGSPRRVTKKRNID